MFFVWQKRTTVERLGGRFDRVHCTNCGCEYFYELIRAGIGSAVSYYSIGEASASSAAVDQSKRDLLQRLTDEAELVPCPKCHWINEDLVNGFRLGRYRGLSTTAFYVGLVGAVGSPVGAWFISIGHAADRAALPYFLYGGPLLTIASVAALLGIQRGLRHQIQPNRDFPMPPKLAPGTPPALLKDESTGELRRASSIADDIPPDSIDFQLVRHRVPQVCCGCLTDQISTLGHQLPVSPTMKLEFPWCSNCARAVARAYRGIWWTVVALAMLIPGAIAFTLKMESFEFWLLIGAASLISLGVASFVASTFTAPVKLTGGDASRSIVSLRFRNPNYGRLVWKQISG